MQARRGAIARELFLVARLDAGDWPAIDPPGTAGERERQGRDIDDRWPWYGRDLAERARRAGEDAALYCGELATVEALLADIAREDFHAADPTPPGAQAMAGDFAGCWRDAGRAIARGGGVAGHAGCARGVAGAAGRQPAPHLPGGRLTTTQQRFTCRQLGTLAGSFDDWEEEIRKREAQPPGLQGMAYQRAAMAFQEAVQRHKRAITDLWDGAAHAAVVAGWTPVPGEEEAG